VRPVLLIRHIPVAHRFTAAELPHFVPDKMVPAKRSNPLSGTIPLPLHVCKASPLVSIGDVPRRA